MIIQIYNLETEGTKFKTDFNKYERIKKIAENRTKNKTQEYYEKLDLIHTNNKLYLCRRYADFKTKEARIQLEEIRGFEKIKS